jgi:hypothetical protein
LKSNNQDTQISIANLINIVINKNINNKGINKNAITKDKRTIITSDNNVTGTVEIETLPITKTHTKDRDQEKEAILIAGIIHMRENTGTGEITMIVLLLFLRVMVRMAVLPTKKPSMTTRYSLLDKSTESDAIDLF